MKSKWFFSRTVPLVLLLSLSVAACIQPIAAPATANDPAAVFDAFHAALNAHDADAALAFFAEDATIQLPGNLPPSVYKGKSEIGSWLEGLAAQHIHIEITSLQVKGDTLTYNAKVDIDALRPLSISLDGPAELTVQQGKITALTHTLNQETRIKLMLASENKPILAVFDLAADSAEQYDQITQALEAAGAGIPKGRLYHIAYATDAGIVVADIWESGALLDQFAQTLIPVVQKLGLTPIQPQIYPVHDIITGAESADLASTAENKPIFIVVDLAFESPELYDQLTKDLEAAGAGSPQGRLYHIAYAKDGGIVVADVWESGELLEQFAQTLVPVLQRGGVTPIQPQIYPVHNIIKKKETTEVPIPALGESPLQITSATVYGQFNGIDYVKYVGHFVNTTNGETFDAPFEIVTPVEPGKGERAADR